MFAAAIIITTSQSNRPESNMLASVLEFIAAIAFLAVALWLGASAFLLPRTGPKDWREKS
jgi:hypothetical protein